MLRLATHAMRTRFEIVLGDEGDAARLRAAGEAALAEVMDAEAMLSRYQSGSDVYRLNNASGQPIRVGTRLLTLLDVVRSLSQKTGGAFDPTVTPLIELWRGEQVPSEGAVKQARELVGIVNELTLNIAARTAHLRDGVQIDPGAWGKGYALDRAAETLREAGIMNALLHGGTSTVVALGAPIDTPDGWPIAIQHPTRTDARLATVHLRDAALSVSAVHGRTFYAHSPDGSARQWGHVIDPRSGYPVNDALLAAVVAPDGLTSDALSTALLVAGGAGLATLANRFPDAALLVAEENAEDSGRLYVEQAGDVWKDVIP